MGGLIEIAGIELNAIDALLYVWFVLAGASTAYVAWDGFVRKKRQRRAGRRRRSDGGYQGHGVKKLREQA